MYGNNCNHNPANPSWFEPPENHTRPKIITQLIDNIQQYYFDPVSTIPSLNFANNSDRQQRSERREACISVLGCLVHYLDLATLRVGIPQADQSFQGISMMFIAERCGLTLKRTERAVKDLVKSGLLTVHPLCEKLEDATYKGYAAIRTINKKLFSLFGLGERLKFEREKASARVRKKQRKAELKNKAKIELLGQSTKQILNSSKRSDAKTEIKNIKSILNTT